ncbi:MAG: hypothetical protein ACT4TC_22820 [Myxococcaceae bacterium]
MSSRLLPDFNRAVRDLLEDVRLSVEEFAHIRPSKILVVAGEARRASRGTVKPLTRGEGPQERRPRPLVKIRGRKILYCITLRPLFFRSSTPKARIGTLLHELFHISPRFDGTLDPEHRHAQIGREFARALRPIVKRYLARCPPEIFAPFAHNGDVRVQQWLERPSTFFVKGRPKARRLYTEEQLFQGTVRMITRRTKVAKAKAPPPKVH